MKQKYYGIDWLRAFSCISILVMHMGAKINNDYEIQGLLFNRVIPSLTNLVFLFMAISAFGMCCGYYEQVRSGTINWTAFYKKRYMKILPFFALLVLLDVVMGFSKAAVCEAMADISLLYGLFPNEIQVIGVGWFLGVVFAFYMIFPFFCVLIENKRRAWISLGISVLLSYLCKYYFDIERKNIVFCLCFFVAGGIVYLYRDEVRQLNKFIIISVLAVSVLIYYMIGDVIGCLLVSAAFLVFGLADIMKANRIVSFISSISMEIYLSHMVIFRVIEKMHLNTIFGNGIFQYIVTCVVVLIGAMIFSYIVKSAIEYTLKRLQI